MRRLHIVGRKNSGKTHLLVELVERLSALGYRVATIKHTHHRHELDTPGKDSWRHRQAGAVAVGILSKNMTAVYLPQAPTSPDDSLGDHDSPPNNEIQESRYDPLVALFGDCDFLLVEGNLSTSKPKVEVWRTQTGTPPLIHSKPGISAVVSDDRLPTDSNVPQFPRRDLSTLIQWLTAEDGLPAIERATISRS